MRVFSFFFFFTKLDVNSFPLVSVSKATPSEKRTKDHVPWVLSHDLQNRPCLAQLHVPEANFVHENPEKTLKMLLAQDERIGKGSMQTKQNDEKEMLILHRDEHLGRISYFKRLVAHKGSQLYCSKY